MGRRTRLYFAISIFLFSSEAFSQAGSVALSQAQKAALAYKCEWSRYEGTVPYPPVPYVNYYGHCYRMPFRKPGRDYTFNVNGTTMVVPAAELKASEQTFSQQSGRSYFFRDHIWCLDPNPPKLANGQPSPTCRPFAYKSCSDSSGNVSKPSPEQMPAHLCPTSVYIRRWKSVYSGDPP